MPACEIILGDMPMSLLKKIYKGSHKSQQQFGQSMRNLFGHIIPMSKYVGINLE